jgi:putative endonuclease
MNQQELGKLGEIAAVQELEAKGFQILGQNYRVIEGEVDIVCKEGETVVFVEVKTRRSRKFGYPEEAISRKKRSRLIKAALQYLEENLLLDIDWRFDLIAIECSPEGRVERLEHLEDIIQGEPGEFI